MLNHETPSRKLFNIINIIALAGLIIATLYPMIYILFASVSLPSEMTAHKGLLLHSYGFTLKAYNSVFEDPLIITGYLNTLFVVVTGVMINLLLTSLGAYFLSRKNVLYKKYVMFLIVFTMFFQGGLIPFYITVKELGLYNTRWALILPVAINTFNLIIMRTGFMTIPDSLEESAAIDGANHLVILFKIVLPLSMPIVAVMILYYGVAHWNSWFNASIFLMERKLYPLQLRLREILVKNDTKIMTSGNQGQDRESVALTIKYAVIIVSTLPILVLYPFLQKYFVKGVMIGAIKG